MADKAFEGLLDWLEKVTDSIDSAAGRGAAELREALADAAADADRKLDALGDRLEDAWAHHDGSHDAAGGSDGTTHAGSHSSSSAVAMAPKAAPKGGNPIKVGLGVEAVKAWGDVKFKLDATAAATGRNDVSVSSKTLARKVKPDKLDVEVAVGTWIKEKGDGDTLDFLVCLTGARKGVPPTQNLKWKDARDVDLIVNVDLKGAPLTAQLKSGYLTKVKCVGENGKAGIGYFGRADDDGKTIKLELSPAKGGAPVAVLALDIKAADGGRPDHPDIPDLFM